LSYLPRARWGEVTAEIQKVFEGFYETRGNVPNLFRVLALRPELLATFNAHFEAVLHESTLGVRLKELVAVRVSQLNGSDY
jgi:alkylhydroperoxidase family enzyme